MKKLWNCKDCDEWLEEKNIDEIKFFRNWGDGMDYEATCKKCKRKIKNVRKT